ncbi:MAG: hypothetical protein JNM84_22215 [Planctomycetes bacterium]|nr:hypothetical protein [Planctomycetota bacterium]
MPPSPSRRLAAALVLWFAIAAPPLFAQSGGGGSYVRIDRPERVRSFYADGAEAWVGRRVHVHLPHTVLAKAETGADGALGFRWKGVRFRVAGSNPALARYNRRAPRGTVLCVKGIVRRAKAGDPPVLLIEDLRVGPLERW